MPNFNLPPADELLNAWQSHLMEENQGVGFEPIFEGEGTLGETPPSGEDSHSGEGWTHTGEGADTGFGSMQSGGGLVWDEEAGAWSYQSNVNEAGETYDWEDYILSMYPHLEGTDFLQDLTFQLLQNYGDINVSPQFIDWMSENFPDVGSWLNQQAANFNFGSIEQDLPESHYFDKKPPEEISPGMPQDKLEEGWDWQLVDGEWEPVYNVDPVGGGSLEIPDYLSEPKWETEIDQDLPETHDEFDIRDWMDEFGWFQESEGFEEQWQSDFWEAVDSYGFGAEEDISHSDWEGFLGTGEDPTAVVGMDSPYHIDPSTGEVIWNEDFDTAIIAGDVEGTLDDWMNYVSEMYPNYEPEALTDLANYLYNHFVEAGIHVSPYWLEEQGFGYEIWQGALGPESTGYENEYLNPDQSYDAEELGLGWSWEYNWDSGEWEPVYDSSVVDPNMEGDIVWDEESNEWVYNPDWGQVDIPEEEINTDPVTGEDYIDPIEGMPLLPEWIEGPYGYKVESGSVIPSENEGFEWHWNPETEDWDEIYIETPGPPFEEGVIMPQPDEYEAVPWSESQYDWEGWNMMPDEMQTFMETLFGDPTQWDVFDTLYGEYGDYGVNQVQEWIPQSETVTLIGNWVDEDGNVLDEYESGASWENDPDGTDTRLQSIDTSYWGYVLGAGDNPFDVINPYDLHSITNAIAAGSEGFEDFLDDYTGDMDYAGLEYLQNLGEWDPNLVNVFTEDMTDRMRLGFYEPMLEQSRAGALQGALSEYGAGLGQALDPVQYEEMLRQYMASGMLSGYENVQAAQQAAYGDVFGVMEDWGQLIAGLGFSDE